MHILRRSALEGSFATSQASHPEIHLVAEAHTHCRTPVVLDARSALNWYLNGTEVSLVRVSSSATAADGMDLHRSWS